MGEQMTPAKVSKWETPTSTHNIHHFTQGRASVDISSHWTSSLQGGSICRGCRLGCADWQVSGVTTLVTPVTSVPPLLLSTGPSRHHRRDRYCNQHRLHNTKYTLNFGLLLFFVMFKYFFECIKIFLLLFPIAGWAAPEPEPECGEQSAECGPVSLLSQ